jgi:hypothetical protein
VIVAVSTRRLPYQEEGIETLHTYEARDKYAVSTTGVHHYKFRLAKYETTYLGLRRSQDKCIFCETSLRSCTENYVKGKTVAQKGNNGSAVCANSYALNSDESGVIP